MKDPKDDLGQSDKGTPDEGEGKIPTILNPKFKSIEEQAKAYNEAEKMATIKSQEAARLQEELDNIRKEEANIEAGKKMMDTQEKTQPKTDFWNRWITDPEGVIEEKATIIAQKMVAPIMEAEKGRAIKQSIEDVARDNPDLKEIQPLVLEKIKLIQERNPALKGSPEVLEMAVGLVRKDQHQAKITQENTERLKREGKGKLSESQFMKPSEVMGEGETGSSPKTHKKKTDEELISDAIVGSGRGKNPVLF